MKDLEERDARAQGRSLQNVARDAMFVARKGWSSKNPTKTFVRAPERWQP